jgi:hypothetical protein
MMIYMENEVEVIPEISSEKIENVIDTTVGLVGSPVSVSVVLPEAVSPAPKKQRKKRVPKEPLVADNHCPACKMGQSLEKGEGTHVLKTIEHPYDPAPPAPEKPAKRVSRPMAKELKAAGSFAEKMLPKKITEKAKLIGDLARVEAEIQEYVRVIQALGGQLPVGMNPVGQAQASNPPVFNPNQGLNYPMPDAQQTPQVAQAIDPDNLRLGQLPDILRAQGGAVNNSELTGSGWV